MSACELRILSMTVAVSIWRGGGGVGERPGRRKAKKRKEQRNQTPSSFAFGRTVCQQQHIKDRQYHNTLLLSVYTVVVAISFSRSSASGGAGGAA
jgi:hypothetical protein